MTTVDEILRDDSSPEDDLVTFLITGSTMAGLITLLQRHLTALRSAPATWKSAHLEVVERIADEMYQREHRVHKFNPAE